MNGTHNDSLRLNGGAVNSNQDRDSITLVDLLDNLFYYRWHFLITFLIVTSASIMYAVISTPIYTADALIQVEDKKGSSLGALTQVATALGAQQSPVLGEIEILRSRSIVGRAVDDLKANIEIGVENRLPIVGNWLSRVLARDPDGLTKPLWADSKYAWGGESLVIDELSVSKNIIGQPLRLIIGENQSWELFDKNKQLILLGDGTGRLEATSDRSVRFQIGALRARPGTIFRIVVFSIPSRVNQILSSLVVTEAKRQSNILKLTFENPSPSYAATVLNAIAEVYVKQNISRRSEEAELSLQFLNEELPKLRTRLDSSEKALNDFRSKTKTIDISAEIRELLIRSTAIEKTQLDLDLKKREYSVRFDSSHPLMQAINAQLSGVKVEYEQLTKQISRLPSVEQDYIRLSRDVQVNNQLYVSLLNNAQQLQIAKAGTIGNVSIVDHAVVPEFASRPKKALIAAIGGLVGIVLGFLFCQALAMVSRVVRDPKKLEHETNLPTLAILPFDENQLARKVDNSPTAFLLAKEKPNAAGVEALRSLRTSVLFKLSEKPRSKVILITSAVPAQGKSFIAANLSYLFAVMGKRVLLLEADIRMSSSRFYFNFVQSESGLSTVLKDNLPVEQAILRNVHPELDFLPSGPTVRNPGDLLATDRMANLINDLAEDYDYLIIDSPPLLPVHDARSLGKSADLSLFVARQDEVSLSEIHDAIDVFSKSGNLFDGIVFNGFIPSRIRYGYGYGYGYRYSRYAAGYRSTRGASYGGYGAYGKQPD